MALKASRRRLDVILCSILFVVAAAGVVGDEAQTAIDKASVHALAQSKKAATSPPVVEHPVTQHVAATSPASDTQEVHKTASITQEHGPSHEQVQSKDPFSQGLSGSGLGGLGGLGMGMGGNSGGTYGVLKSLGDKLGLSKVLSGEKNHDAKPAAQAIQSWLKAKHPHKAWSSALTIVGTIGGTVILITAVGTYFIAKAENKKLKKAKKTSNLLGGRYGSVKKEEDSDDERPMRDMV